MSCQKGTLPAAESLKDSVLKERSGWCTAANPTCAFDKVVEHTAKIPFSLSEDVVNFHEKLSCGQRLRICY